MARIMSLIFSRRPVLMISFWFVLFLLPSSSHNCCYSKQKIKSSSNVAIVVEALTTKPTPTTATTITSHHHHPLLATEWIVSKLIGIGTRVVLLIPPSLPITKQLLFLRRQKRSSDNDDGDIKNIHNNQNKNKISVNVKGKSNKQILQGKFQTIDLSVKNSHGLLIDISSLTIQAFNVKLGLWPLFMVASIPVLLKLRPSPLLVLLLYMFYRSSRTYQYPTMFEDKSSSTLQEGKNDIVSRTIIVIRRVLSSIKKRLNNNGKGPSSWSMKYKLRLSQSNINQSPLIKFGLKQILRSLMLNSVLKVAAVTGDTMNQLQKEIEKEKDNNLNKQRNSSRFLRLKPSVDLINNNNKNNDVSRRKFSPPPQSSQPSSSSPPQQELTKLLEATNFDLQKVTLVEPQTAKKDKDHSSSHGGHLIFDANAIMKDKKSSFSYTLRVIPEATRIALFEDDNNNTNNNILKQQPQQQQQKQHYALAFANPECRFATSAFVERNSIFKKFLPDLWIPVGPGIALPLGRTTTTTKHRIIENIRIVSSSDDGDSSSSDNIKNNNNNFNNKENNSPPTESSSLCCEIIGTFSFNNNNDESSSMIITSSGDSGGGTGGDNNSGSDPSSSSSQRKALPPSGG